MHTRAAAGDQGATVGQQGGSVNLTRGTVTPDLFVPGRLAVSGRWGGMIARFNNRAKSHVRGGDVQIGKGAGQVDVAFDHSQSAHQIRPFLSLGDRQFATGDNDGPLRLRDIDDKGSVVRVGDKGVFAGDGHAPHVVADLVGPRKLDARNETRLRGILQVEDLQSVAATMTRVAGIAPRRLARMMSGRGKEKPVLHGHAVAVAVQGDL